MIRKFQLSFIYLLLLITGTMNLYSQETGHYVPGIAGIKAGTLPPPGFYYVMHNIYYTADTYYDGNGDEAPIDFRLNVFSNAHRFVYVWEDVLFGANYAMNVIIPLVSTDISIGAFNVDDNQFGIGDVIIEPFVLSWNKPGYDLAFGLAAVAPVGSYDIMESASPGKSFWTGLLTFGGTYYFDSHKSWHASILSRYEVHSAKKDYDITPGNDFTFEWGVAKTFLSKFIWNFGVSGYAHWQLSDDDGSDVQYDPSVHDRVFAAGPEVTCFIPPIKLNVELRGQFEFGAIDRPQGTTMCLSFFKGI